MSEELGNYRDVSVCGVPHRMTIVDGGVMFSNRSGFYGYSGRYMFEYAGMLWYLIHSESTFGKVAAAHLAKMHKLLSEMISPDHTESSGKKFVLRFTEDQE